MSLTAEYLPNYTVEDYQRWEGDWELIEGIPFALSPPPTVNHQRVVRELIIQIAPNLESAKGWELWHNLDWIANDRNVYRPDVMATHDVKVFDFVRSSPELIFEVVSPATANKDKNLKFKQYERFGVKWYVLIDPKTKSVKIFKHNGNQYVEAIENIENYEFSLSSDCELTFNFNSIWST